MQIIFILAYEINKILKGLFVRQNDND